MPVVGSVALAAPHKMSKELFSTVVIVDKSYGELFLLVQWTTCTFGPAKGCNFKKLKVYEYIIVTLGQSDYTVSKLSADAGSL